MFYCATQQRRDSITFNFITEMPSHFGAVVGGIYNVVAFPYGLISLQAFTTV